MTRAGVLRTFLAAALFIATLPASAHTRSESYSNWQLSDSGATGTVTVSSGEVIALLDAANPQPLDALFIQHVAASTSVQANGRTCAPRAPVSLASARGFIRVELGFDCQGAAPTLVRYRALFDALPAHVHFMRLFANNERLAERVVTARSSAWQRDSDAARESFTEFLDLGVRHILSGIDHIAFLAGLLLVAGTLGRSVAAVTGFTLGHSLSLITAVLGYLQADSRLVEAFIGFTVMLVAVEFFLHRRPQDRWLGGAVALLAAGGGVAALLLGTIDTRSLVAYAGFAVFSFCYLRASARLNQSPGRTANLMLFAITTCFGLVHGFGFAGFLLESGLSGGNLVLPLLGFNLGVEAGQLTLLALAFVLGYLLRSTPAYRLAPIGAAALCGIGVFWFVGRSLAA
ncbi:MAG: HupE/UreJ family protein [Pseudomonadota bacterium]